ncbi:MAG TPA: Stp1/IreP family PP2C-type Ser/Thr phosphatase [Armatimonadaceae bacterium]|nr:Stp1/IreP family PP2C-type Ser/Thr phosphatase [Armatimonadaceae bacterium]
MSQERTAELDGALLLRGWAAMESVRATPAVRADIAWAARTDIGRHRENNEDKFDFFLPDDPMALAMRGRLWAVADGMGGHSAGQIASEAALKALVRSYYAETTADAPEALRAALTDANALIHQASKQFENTGGMGTTLVAAVVRDDTVMVAHVGDSRAYLLREGERLRQITTDHSWVEEQVRRGALSREQAEASPYRNYITRSVGVLDTVDPDVVTETLRPGDLLLMCSDGLTGYVDGDALEAILRRSQNPSRLVLDLIDAANDAGGRDNITALVLAVRAVEPWREPA